MASRPFMRYSASATVFCWCGRAFTARRYTDAYEKYQRHFPRCRRGQTNRRRFLRKLIDREVQANVPHATD